MRRTTGRAGCGLGGESSKGSILQVPAPFDYERATSVEHAIALLEELGPGARLLAGGHSLLPMMKLRLAVPDHVIDIDPLAGELGYVREHDGEVAHRRDDAPPRPARVRPPRAPPAIFTDAERVIADPVVRNRGTIGGALCQADPSEDLSAVCAAVGARMVIRGSARRARHRHGRVPPRAVPRRRSSRPRCSSRSASRCAPGSGSAYEKVDRRAGDWAVVAAGAAVELAGGTIARAGHRARRRRRRHHLARGRGGARGPGAVGRGVRRARRALAAAACAPVSDQRGSADYKRHVAGVLTERVLRRATARALGEEA